MMIFGWRSIGMTRRATVLACLLVSSTLASPVLWAAQPRQPHVAGQFYPSDPQELRALIDELVSREAIEAGAQKPRALIVPHAGYRYSGPVAASAFRLLRGQRYDGVVVVGFMHRFVFEGVSVDIQDSYQTPLGLIPVDQAGVHALKVWQGANHSQSIRFVHEAHEAPEHSLEVMLPFLQATLGEFKLVPVLIGRADAKVLEHLADALAELAKRGDYLFVFSTDLSHYHEYQTAKFIDERTVNSIMFETPQAIDRLFDLGLVEACGRGPITTALFLGAKLGYLRQQLISYANSGDTAGDHASVVGYAAIGLFDQPAPPEGLPEVAGWALVQAARRSLGEWLVRGQTPEPVSVEQYPELARSSGVFVTLRRHGALRGCIGRLQTKESLAQSVPQVALDAALQDTRFSPVTADELDELEVEVSVLTPAKRLATLKDLVPGRDGVILEHDEHHGVFLPAVWAETGWTRLEFLRELASQKAGLPADAWRKATLLTFQDQVFVESPDHPH